MTIPCTNWVCVEFFTCNKIWLRSHCHSKQSALLILMFLVILLLTSIYIIPHILSHVGLISICHWKVFLSNIPQIPFIWFISSPQFYIHTNPASFTNLTQVCFSLPSKRPIIVNSNSPSTEPFGTPLITPCHVNKALFKATHLHSWSCSRHSDVMNESFKYFAKI